MSKNLLFRLVVKINQITNKYFPVRAMINSSQQLFFHRERQLSATPVNTPIITDNEVVDTELVKRIINAYQGANKVSLGDSMWGGFYNSHHKSIHHELMSGDVDTVSKIFRDPRTSDLFYGFDILCKSFNGVFDNRRFRNQHANRCLDNLVRFAESIGAIPIDNPEGWSIKNGNLWEAEEVLERLNKKCWSFSVPNPFPGEHGLGTSRGVISYRVPQALYQAWRIKQLVNEIDNPRVLEIGAGLGRTAFYAHELGLKDYSVVDIPITLASQAYFLGRTVGEENVHLDGESSKESTRKIKLLTPERFLNEIKSYDLIVNFDSLTEIDRTTANEYWEKIKSLTNTFLSINHELNDFRVQDLIANDLPSIEIIRSPYWMRLGYVEELIRMKLKN